MNEPTHKADISEYADGEVISNWLSDADPVVSITVIAQIGPKGSVKTVARVPSFDFDGVPLHDSTVDYAWAAMNSNGRIIGGLELWWPQETHRKLQFDMEHSIGRTLMSLLAENSHFGIAHLAITNAEKGLPEQLTGVDMDIGNDETFDMLLALGKHFDIESEDQA